jgi:competence protein ComFC
MAIVDTHPEPIDGPWIEGFVLDRHVIKSIPIGYYGEHMQFDTTRSALGELVYQFKNRSGPSEDIVDTAAAFAEKRWTSTLDCVVAAPPSISRARQPAVVLAEGIGAKLGLPVLDGVVAKTKTPPMKNVPPAEREAMLRDAIGAGKTSVAGMRVLIVDDLWQTGGTMRRVAEVLKAMGAAEIRALAMTRTK